MRAALAASVALAQQQLFLAPGANMNSMVMNGPAQVPVVYDEAQLEFAQPVVYAQPAAAPSGSLDLSWVLPGVAVLAVGAAAGAYAGKAQREAALEAEDAAYEADLEAALDTAQVLALAGPLPGENKVAMLFSSGKKAAPKGKAAPKKAAPKKAAPKKAAPKKVAPKKVARPVAKKPAAKKPVARKVSTRGKLAGPKLQAASSAIPFLKELFSLSAVGGAKGNVLGIK
jgi:hypothetical protein